MKDATNRRLYQFIWIMTSPLAEVIEGLLFQSFHSKSFRALFSPDYLMLRNAKSKSLDETIKCPQEASHPKSTR